jgi:hypothetical protein
LLGAVTRRDRLTGTALREFDKALELAEIGRIAPGETRVTTDPATVTIEKMAQ